jgi:hypothetical protein
MQIKITTKYNKLSPFRDSKIRLEFVRMNIFLVIFISTIFDFRKGAPDGKLLKIDEKIYFLSTSSLVKFTKKSL